MGGPFPGDWGGGVAQALGGRILSFLFFFPLPSCRPPPVERGHKAKKIKIILDLSQKKKKVPFLTTTLTTCRSLPAVHLEAALLRFLPFLPSLTSLSTGGHGLTYFYFLDNPRSATIFPQNSTVLAPFRYSFLPVTAPRNMAPAEYYIPQRMLCM